MFKKLFGSKQAKTSQPVLPPLPFGFQQTLANFFGSNALPSMPQAVHRIFQVVTDPNSEALDFVAAIESDEGLSSRIIKIANSVYFDRGSGSNSVVEAVATIGTKELRNILSAVSLKQLFPSNHPLRTQLWEHNIAVAIFSREIAARVLAGQEGEAFLAGLLHDIGKLLILSVDYERYAKVAKEAGHIGGFCQAETTVYPFDHTEVGHYIAEKWGFSKELTEPIRMHHIEAKDLPKKSIALIVKTADLLAHKLKIGFPSGFVTLQNNSAISLIETIQLLGFESTMANEFIKQVTTIYLEETARLE